MTYSCTAEIRRQVSLCLPSAPPAPPRPSWRCRCWETFRAGLVPFCWLDRCSAARSATSSGRLCTSISLDRSVRQSSRSHNSRRQWIHKQMPPAEASAWPAAPAGAFHAHWCALPCWVAPQSWPLLHYGTLLAPPQSRAFGLRHSSPSPAVHSRLLWAIAGLCSWDLIWRLHWKAVRISIE